MNPAPVDQAKVLVVFPDGEANREDALSDDEAKRLFDKFTKSVNRVIDDKKELLEALDEKYKGFN